MNKISRRQFLSAGAALGGLSVGAWTSTAWTMELTTTQLELNEFSVAIPDLPSAFDGFRMGVMSDIHLGPCVDHGLFERGVELLAQQQLDVLLLVGDYVLVLDMAAGRYFYRSNCSEELQKSCPVESPNYLESLEIGKSYFARVAQGVQRLNPKHGILAVLGNHDRWNSGDNCSEIFLNSGIEMLVNRQIALSQSGQTLEFYGADDFSTGVPKAPTTTSKSRILLSHNPDFLSETSNTATFALGIAGHTHGGQVNLPMLGPIGVQVEDRRLIQGLIPLGGAQILVSKGVGTSGIPWRVNCKPEVNLVTLQRSAGPSKTLQAA